MKVALVQFSVFWQYTTLLTGQCYSVFYIAIIFFHFVYFTLLTDVFASFFLGKMSTLCIFPARL